MFTLQTYRKRFWRMLILSTMLSLLLLGCGTAQQAPVTPSQSASATPPPTLIAVASVTKNSDWKPIEQDYNGVPMMLVPPGCFNMGSDDGTPEEKPVTKICFDKPFLIDKMEVTQEQFSHMGGIKGNESEFVGVKQPIEMISWDEARDFCEQRRGARLPTEAEWEYAARGPDNLIYPWGNEWNKTNAVFNNYDENNRPLGPADVGSIPAGASWVGALDMIGNVGEWTSSLMMPYPYNRDDGRENPDQNSGYYRVARGNSAIGTSLTQARAAWRGQLGANNISNRETGFRCARS